MLPSRLRALFAIDFARHNAIMESMQQFFGPYPFGSYVVVVTDDELDYPIEAQGMSIFGANHVDGVRGVRAQDDRGPQYVEALVGVLRSLVGQELLELGLLLGVEEVSGGADRAVLAHAERVVAVKAVCGNG